MKINSAGKNTTYQKQNLAFGMSLVSIEKDVRKLVITSSEIKKIDEFSRTALNDGFNCLFRVAKNDTGDSICVDVIFVSPENLSMNVIGSNNKICELIEGKASIADIIVGLYDKAKNVMKK